MSKSVDKTKQLMRKQQIDEEIKNQSAAEKAAKTKEAPAASSIAPAAMKKTSSATKKAQQATVKAAVDYGIKSGDIKIPTGKKSTASTSTVVKTPEASAPSAADVDTVSSAAPKAPAAATTADPAKVVAKPTTVAPTATPAPVTATPENTGGEESTPSAIQTIQAQPTEEAQAAASGKWYKGDTPTGAEIQARILTLNETDQASAESMWQDYNTLLNDPASPIYSPYRSSTNPAVGTLQELGITLPETNVGQWLKDNAYLKNYYVTGDGSSTTPKAPTKSSTDEERAAYYYYQVDKQQETTEKALTEWEALQEELTYWAGRTDRNLSDDEIIAMVDWDKYPTLNKMDEGRESGVPLSLNESVGYSSDNMLGVIWNARNGENLDVNVAAVRYAQGVGTQWTEDPELTAKLDPSSDSYAPYTVGSTMDSACLYFGVSSFPAGWAEEHKDILNSGDETAIKMYKQVVEAEETTSAAEEEMALIDGKLENAVKFASADRTAEEIVDNLLSSKNAPTLLKLEKSQEGTDLLEKSQEGTDLLDTTRAIGFSRAELVQKVQEMLDRKAENATGQDYTGSVEESVGATVTPQSGTDASITAAQNENILAAGETIEVSGTDAEKAVMNVGYTADFEYSVSLLTSAITGGAGNVQTSYDYAIKTADTIVVNTYEKNLEIVAPYEEQQDRLDEANQVLDLIAGYENGEYKLQTADGTELTDEEAAAFVATYKPVYEQQKSEAELYMQENQQAYDSASGAINGMLANYEAANRLMALTGQAGTSDGTELMGVLDWAYTYGSGFDEENTWSSLSLYDQALAEGSSREEVVTAARQGLEENTNALIECEYVLKYIEDHNIQVDADTLAGLKAYHQKVNRDVWAARYFLTTENEDFEEVVAQEKENIKAAQGSLGKYDTLTYQILYPNGQYGGMDGQNPYANQMTQEERDTYIYLLSKEGKDSAVAYYNSLADPVYGTLVNRYSGAVTENLTTFANNAPVSATALSIIASPMKWLDLVNQGYQSLVYGEMNPNTDLGSIFTGTLQGTVQNNLVNWAGGEDSVGGKIASILYSAATSGLESWYTGKISSQVLGNVFAGWKALESSSNITKFMAKAFQSLVLAAPMGLEAMSGSIHDATERGADAGQAWLLGLSTFFSETITEAITIDNMKSTGMLGKFTGMGDDEVLKTGKEFVKELVGNMAEEGLAEGINEYLESDLFDNLIMGELGSRQTFYDEYKQQHPDAEEDEISTAYFWHVAQGILEAAIVGGISAGMTEGSAHILQSVTSRSSTRRSNANSVVSEAAGTRTTPTDVTAAPTETTETTETTDDITGAPEDKTDSVDVDPDISETEDEEGAPSVKPSDEATADMEAEEESTPANETSNETSNEGTETSNAGEETSGEEAAPEYDQAEVDQASREFVALTEAESNTDDAVRTETIAGALASGGQDLANQPVAIAAAETMANRYGTAKSIQTMKDLLLTGTEQHVPTAALHSAIEMAVLGNGKAAAVMENIMQNGVTEENVMELVTAANEDYANQQSSSNMDAAVTENRIANEVRNQIANGALKAVAEVRQQYMAAQEATRALGEKVDRKAQEFTAAKEALTTLSEQLQQNPGDSTLVASVQQATAKVEALYDEGLQLMEQQDKAQATEEALREKLKTEENEILTQLRQTAKDTIAQQEQAEAEARAQAQAAMEAAEAAKAQAEADARAQADAQAAAEAARQAQEDAQNDTDEEAEAKLQAIEDEEIAAAEKAYQEAGTEWGTATDAYNDVLKEDIPATVSVSQQYKAAKQNLELARKALSDITEKGAQQEKAYQDEITQHETAAQEAEDELARVTQEVWDEQESLNQEYEAQKQALADEKYKAKQDELQAKLEDYQKRVETLEKNIEEGEANGTASATDIANGKRSIEKGENAIAQVQAQLKSLTQERAEYIASLTDEGIADTDATAQIESLQAEIADYEQRAERLRTHLEENAETASAEDLERGKANLAKGEEKIQDMRSRLEVLQKRAGLNDRKAKNAEAQTRISELDQKAKSERAAAEQATRKLENSRKATQENTQKAEASVQTAEEAFGRATAENESAQAAYNEWKTRYDSAKSAKEAASTKWDEAAKAVGETKNRVKEQRKARQERAKTESGKNEGEGSQIYEKAAYTLQNKQDPADSSNAANRSAAAEDTAKGKKPKKSPYRVFIDLAEDLGLGHDAGTRKFSTTGGTTSKYALAYYDSGRLGVVVRGKFAGAFTTTMHEIGHHVDFMLARSFNKDANTAASVLEQNQNRADLCNMVAKLDPKFIGSYNKNVQENEAFAEFFWQYMSNKDMAEAYAGKDFIKRFETRMEKYYPSEWKNIQKARHDLQLYLNASILDRLNAVIKDHKDVAQMKAKKEAREFGMKILTGLVDKTAPIKKLDDVIAKKAVFGTPAKIQDEALRAGFAEMRAASILTDTYVSSDNETVGKMSWVDKKGEEHETEMKGFSATMREAGLTMKNYDLVKSYIAAKVGVERANSKQKDLYGLGSLVFDDISLNEKDLQKFIDETDASDKDISKIADAFFDWQKMFLYDYLVNGNRMTFKKFWDLQKANPHYMHVSRVMDIQGTHGGNGNGNGGTTSALMHSKGGSQDIFNPFESLQDLVTGLVKENAKNKVGLALHRYASARGSSLGAFVRPITQDYNITNVSQEHLTKAVETKAASELKGLGYDKTQIEDILGAFEAIKSRQAVAKMVEKLGYTGSQAMEIEDILNGSGRIFTETNDSSQPNTLKVYLENGEVALYEVYNDALYEALSLTNPKSAGSICSALAWITRGMAKLTTGSNPFFAAKNAMRDYQNSVNNGTWAVTYIDGLPKWIKSFAEVAKGTSNDIQTYRALGGSGTELTMGQTKSYQDVKNAMTGAKDSIGKRAWKAVTLERLNEIIEQTSRFAEYKYGKKGRTNQERFMAAQEVTVNFNRGGNSALAADLKCIIPFFGASVQGTARTVRTVETLFDKGASKEAKQHAGIALAKTVGNTMLTSILANTLLIKWLGDDEKKEYLEASSDMKTQNFILPNPLGGNPIRVPLDQNPIGYLVNAAVTNTMWGIGTKDNPELEEACIKLNSLGNTILDSINPFNDTTIQPFIDVASNQTWYGGALEGYSVSKLQDQSLHYTEDTPEFFKVAGRMLGFSPIKLQYLAEQYTGFVGQIAIPMLSYEKNGELGGLRALTDGLKKKFTFNYQTSTEVINGFYNAYDFLDSDSGVTKAVNSGLPLNMLRHDLTGEEALAAYQEAYAMTHKGGAMYEAKQIISDGYDRIEEIQASETLTEAEKNQQIKEVRSTMIWAAMDANEEFGAYKEKYVTGESFLTKMFTEGTTVEKPEEEAKPTGVDAMSDLFKSDLDSGENYMTQAKTVYEATGSESALPHPSYSFSKNSVKYEVENTDEFDAWYREGYTDYLGSYWDDGATDEEKLEILTAAHREGMKLAKDQYVGKYGD